MLYLTVMTHGPETCPGVVHELTHKVLEDGQKMEAVAKANGVTMQGVWLNRSGHSSWAVVDAPDGHAVDKFLRESGLFEWNTAVTHPVVTIQEAMGELAQQHAH
jgi:hypothetical protein